MSEYVQQPEIFSFNQFVILLNNDVNHQISFYVEQTILQKECELCPGEAFGPAKPGLTEVNATVLVRKHLS